MKISGYWGLTLLLLFGVIFEALSAVEWASYPLFPDRSLFFAKADATLFAILVPFSPTLLILLLYAWIPKLAASLDNNISRRLRNYFVWLVHSASYLRHQAMSDSDHGFALMDRPRILLGVAVSLAVLLGLVPFRPDLNPAMTPVGVDAHFYVEALNQMLQRSPAAAISFAFGDPWAGTRPLIVTSMYLTVAAGFVSVNHAVEALPAILGPILAVSTFIFVKTGSQNERLAGVASVLSALSFSTTVGMWAGFYANWLALSEAYLFLAALFAFLRNASPSKFTIMTLLSVGLLFTHPPTWTLVTAVAAIFVVTVWRDAGKTILLKPFVLLFAINIIVDLAKTRIFGGVAVAQDSAVILSSSSGISQILAFWPNIINGLFVTYGGLLGNAILLGLPIIATLFLRFNDKFERLLGLWVALGSLPFLVLSSGTQTRIVYDMPLSVLTSIALFLLIRPLGSKTIAHNLIFLLVLLLSANYALRAVTNLFAIPF